MCVPSPTSVSGWAPIEVRTFIGSSPIRQYAEDWTTHKMVATLQAAVTFAVNGGLPVMMVTEDTTRASPEVLKALYEGEALCKRIFKAAKQTDHTLTEGEVRAICRAG